MHENKHNFICQNYSARNFLKFSKFFTCVFIFILIMIQLQFNDFVFQVCLVNVNDEPFSGFDIDSMLQ